MCFVRSELLLPFSANFIDELSPSRSILIPDKSCQLLLHWKWLNSNIDHPKASIKWWNDKMCVSKTWINSNREVVRDSHIERNRKEDIRNVYDLYFQRYLLKTWKSDPYQVAESYTVFKLNTVDFRVYWSKLPFHTNNHQKAIEESQYYILPTQRSFHPSINMKDSSLSCNSSVYFLCMMAFHGLNFTLLLQILAGCSGQWRINL